MTLRQPDRGIGGTLDWQRLHFTVLPEPERVAAIRRLHASGMSTRGIAEATGLALPQVESLLAGSR